MNESLREEPALAGGTLLEESDFCVLLAVYAKDSPELLKRALTTVAENSLAPAEILIVADGPLNARLDEVILSFSVTLPITIVRLPTNVGLARALNEALPLVKSTYVIRADADDFNDKNRFAAVIEKLAEGFDLVGSQVREVDLTGNEVALRLVPESEVEIRKFIKRRNPFNHMTVGFRTRAVLDVGGYPEIYLKEDYALWATLIARGVKACNLQTQLVTATAGREMFRRRGGLKSALAEMVLQQHLCACGLKSGIEAFVDGILRASIFLAPNFIREWFYLRFLRRVG